MTVPCSTRLVRILMHRYLTILKSDKYFSNVSKFTILLVQSPGWHEVDDSKPRFQGRLVVIDGLFSRVWKSHEQFSSHHSNDSKRPRSINEAEGKTLTHDSYLGCRGGGQSLLRI